VPIPLSLAGGALTTTATVDGMPTPFPVVVDTGTPLTVYDDHSQRISGRTGNFRLFSSAGVPRLEYDGVQLFDTPLGTLGLAAMPIDGILGGDNLQRTAVTFDYRGGAPSMTLIPQITTCGCALADECNAVFPFSLEGGQNTIDLSGDLYNYPATRVVIDVCLQPLADPVSQDAPCNPGGNTDNPLAAVYLPSGIDVKLMVASGFPGVAISSGALARLAGQAAVDAALASPTTLHLPDPADDPISVGQVSLGDATHAALALVSSESYFGPCAELARSRRLRRFKTQPDLERACALDKRAPDVGRCSSATNSDCSDQSTNTAASIVELAAPLPAYVLADSTPLLIGINDDVQPSNAAVEGLIGTAALARLVATVDYPSNRLIAQCAADGNCIMYPRFTNGTSCGLNCSNLDAITAAAMSGRAGGVCPKAPGPLPAGQGGLQ
jgi:hypothetical protein